MCMPMYRRQASDVSLAHAEMYSLKQLSGTRSWRMLSYFVFGHAVLPVPRFESE